MTSDDLRDLFKTVAAEATDTVELDEDTLVPRIRQNRRRRVAVTGLAGLATAAVIAVGAYAVLPGNGTTGPTGTQVAGQDKNPMPADGPQCGGTIAASFPLGANSGREGLQILKQRVRTTQDGWGGGLHFEVMDMRNLDQISDRIGETSTFVVTQKHVVVGSAVVTVTKPLTTRSVQARIDLRPCGSPSPAGGDVDLHGPLFPGRHPITFFTLQLAPR